MRMRRRHFGRLAALAVVTLAIVLSFGVLAAHAAVWTGDDQNTREYYKEFPRFFYDWGDTVHIFGDEMWPSEPVVVEVYAPEGSLEQYNTVFANEAGEFLDTFFMYDTAPAGIYLVIATGQASGAVFVTEFDPYFIEIGPTAVSPPSPGPDYSDFARVTGKLESTTKDDEPGSKPVTVSLDGNRDGDYLDYEDSVVTTLTGPSWSTGGQNKAATFTVDVPLRCLPSDPTSDATRYTFVVSHVGARNTPQTAFSHVDKEDTRVTYGGATSGIAGTPLALAATVADLDGGSPAPPGGLNGTISPDPNLAGANLATFELFNSAETVREAGPVLANVDATGKTTGSPAMTLPSDGGTYKLVTRFVGNAYYKPSKAATVTVAVAAPTTPKVTAPASQIATEGVAKSFSLGSFSDPDGGPWTVTVAWGDGTPNDVFTTGSAGSLGTRVHTYADGPAVRPVSVTVEDSTGRSGSAAFAVTVANVAPSVDAGADAAIDEGDTFSQSGSFTDPGDDSWTATVDYGEGAGEVPLTLTGKTFSLSNVYEQDGSYVVTVTVTDDDETSRDTLAVTVANVAPDATDDSYSVNEDGILSVDAPGVLANDSDVPADLPLSAAKVSNPVHGTVTVGADGSFTYTPSPNFHGTDSFKYEALDDDTSTIATVTITVRSVNDAPAGTDKTVTTLEDTTYTFAAANFGFTDPNDSIAHNVLAAVKIATLPAKGVLRSNGAAVAEGDFISAADIADGKLRFSPVADENGSQYTSFTFQVQDNGGTERGGVDLDPTPNTLTINVTPVNDAPVVVSVTPSTQTKQYSDSVTPIVIVAEDIDSPDLTISGSLCADLAYGSPSSTPMSDPTTGDGVRKTFRIAGRAMEPEGTYNMNCAVSDGATSVNAAVQLVVSCERAKVVFDDNSPAAVQVTKPGGSAPAFTLIAWLHEDDTAEIGDRRRAVVTARLVPIGPGSGCAGVVTGPDAEGKFTIAVPANLAVNTYVVEVTVNGRYYTGYTEGAVTVYDPSLGFTTGGGWFYWPDSENGTNKGDKTNFGYTMKYNKNGTNVQGSLLLIRHMPDGTIYRVKSNALGGLALSSPTNSGFGWASFTGRATYQSPTMALPEGNHSFTAYVEDRNEPGTGVDRFWIETRDKESAVIGDLSLGRSPSVSANAVSIRGGNIVVPHK